MKYLVEFRGDCEVYDDFSDAIQAAKDWKKHYLRGGYKLYTQVANEEIRIYVLIATVGELKE